jgi:hypothetical protein
MKKLIYIAVLLAGFQFVQAQEITGIYLIVSQQQIVPLEGLTLPPIPQPTGTLNFIVEITNTGEDDLSPGDSLYFQVLFNNDTLIKSAKLRVTTAPFIKDSVLQFNCPITFPAVLCKQGIKANKLCMQVPMIVIGGVPKQLQNDYCANFTISDEAGIEDIDNLQEIKIFPNPVHDNNLKIESLNEAIDVEIYNITGQLIQKESAVMGNVNMDVSNLSNGLYILKIQNGKNVRTEKIQIMR